MIPQFKKILFATDLSAGAKEAMGHAESLAARFDGRVTVLHVVLDVVSELSAGPGVELISQLGDEQWRQLTQEKLNHAKDVIRKHVDQWLDEVKLPKAESRLAQAEVLLKIGRPVDLIVGTAEEGDFDVVVLGSRGHSALAEFFMGSVASGVLKRCSRPVLMVRVPPAE